MTCNVLYAIGSRDAVSEVCGELATAIVENKASKYKIKAIVFTKDSVEPICELRKLTVALVEEIRQISIEAYEREEEMKTDLQKFSNLVKTEAARLADNFDVLVAYSDKDHVDVINMQGEGGNDNDVIDQFIGGGRPSQIPVRSVKLMKTFDGNFTVGDIENPLLSIPVYFYPVTRHSGPIDVASFVDGKRVVQTSNFKTESGAPIDPGHLEKAYTYLNELVPVDEGVQSLMEGEFEGAEIWGKAFELLATVPRVPPWLLLERTDCVVGATNAAVHFLAALHTALEDSKMHAIARLCRDPKSSGGVLKRKGKLELVVLQPGKNKSILVSPLPFREDYKYYYRFFELPTEPSAEDEEIDAEMDKIVDATNEPPQPRRNQLVERVARYVRDKIADGSAEIPPLTDPLPKAEHIKEEDEKELQSRTARLAEKIGIVEHVKLGDGNAEDVGNLRDTQWEFDFV